MDDCYAILNQTMHTAIVIKHHSFPVKGATDVTKTLRLHWNLEKDRKIIKKERVRKVPGKLSCELNAMFCHFLLSISKNQTIAEEFFLFATTFFPLRFKRGIASRSRIPRQRPTSRIVKEMQKKFDVGGISFEEPAFVKKTTFKGFLYAPKNVNPCTSGREFDSHT